MKKTQKAIWDSEKRQFAGRDGMSWAKLCLFYGTFYLMLAGLFVLMTLFVMVFIPKSRPKYILGESTMAVLTPLNPGLGFRPKVPKHYDLIKFDIGNDSNENQSWHLYVKSLEDFLQSYQNNASANCTEISHNLLNETDISCNFYLEPLQCSRDDKFGYQSGEPCVLIKLNRIYGWTSNGASSCPTADQKSDGKASIKGPGDIRIKCLGESDKDTEHIETIEYYSYNGRSRECADIPNNNMYFPFRSQADYLSPYVWAKFNVKRNTLVSIICRAYAENIDSIQKLKMRGMLRIKLFVGDHSQLNNDTVN